MKTVSKFLGMLGVFALLASCSSVKVSDAWKDSRVEDINGGKVLVVFKSNDNISRQRFEKDMATQIKARGPQFEVLPSYINFPTASPDAKISPEKTAKLRETLKSMAVDVAVVTTIKTIKESTVTSVNTDPGVYGAYGYGGYGYGGYGGYYSGRYSRGYYGGMNMGYVSSTAVTSTEKQYVVETCLYDLSLPETEQLLAVVTSLVDNPQSIVTTSDDFAKAVVKQLFKK